MGNRWPDIMAIWKKRKILGKRQKEKKNKKREKKKKKKKRKRKEKRNKKKKTKQRKKGEFRAGLYSPGIDSRNTAPHAINGLVEVKKAADLVWIEYSLYAWPNPWNPMCSCEIVRRFHSSSRLRRRQRPPTRPAVYPRPPWRDGSSVSSSLKFVSLPPGGPPLHVHAVDLIYRSA
jgi:hypothetical protein